MLRVDSNSGGRLQGLSLRAMLLLFAAGLLLPVLAASLLALHRMESREQAHLDERARQIARDLSNDLDREFKRTMVVLDTLADSPFLQSGDYAAFSKPARAAASGLGATRIVLLGADLRPLIDTAASEDPLRVDHIDEETARRARDSGIAAVSDRLIEPDEGRWIAQVHTPVRIGGAIRYVLVGMTGEKHYQSVLEEQGVASGWTRAVVDAHGRAVVVASDGVETGSVVSGDNARSARSRWDVPQAAVTAAAKSGLANWSVYVAAAQTAPRWPLETPRSMWMLGLAGTFLLAPLFAVLFGRLMGRPMHKAAEAVALIGRGEKFPGIRSNLAEVNDVAVALNKASEDLRKRTRALKEARDEARKRAREAEEARALLQTLLQHVPEGITIALGAPDFPIVANSRMASELLGDEQVLGLPAGAHASKRNIFRSDGSRPLPEDMPLYRACHFGEPTVDQEWIIERRDGRRITCLVNVTPMRDSSGEIIGAVNCWRDITTRKEQETKLRRAMALSEVVSVATPALMYAKDLEGRLTMVNPAMAKAAQLSEAEMLGKSHTDLYGDDETSRQIAAHDRQVIEEGLTLEVEEIVIRPDGERSYLSTKSPIFDRHGRAAGLVGVSLEITDRKRAEVAQQVLRELEHDIATLSDSSEIIQRAVARLGRHLGASRCHLTTLDPAQEVATVEPGWLNGAGSITGTYNIKSEGTAELQAALAAGEMIAVDDVTSDPRTELLSQQMINLDIAAFASIPVTTGGELRGLLSVHSPTPRRWRAHELNLMREVAWRVWSEREQAEAEKALRVSEERNRLAASAIQGVIYDVDVAAGHVERSQGLAALIGFRPEEVPAVSKWWRDRCHPDDIARITGEHRAAVAERRAHLECRYRVLHRDGRWIHVMDRCLVLYGDDGKACRWVGSIIDVTAQEHAEARLRETEERFRALVQASAQTVWMANADGEMVEDSPSWRAFTGQTMLQFLGSGWLDAVHPQDRDAAREAMHRTIASEAPGTFEYRLRHQSGDWRWTQVRAVPLVNAGDGIRAWVGMNTDITERRNWEEQQKLLLAELSHRVKNVLAVVQSMAARTLTGGRSVSEAGEILVRRLHALARAHDMLTTRNWRGAPLRAIVEGELAPFVARTRIEGPDVMIGPRMAQTLALVLHELATNATKHGALSNEDGQVSVTWAVIGEDEDARFTFQWRETGGPPVEPPKGKGFGTALLNIAITADTDGASPLRFEPGGVVYEINVPVSSVV